MSDEVITSSSSGGGGGCSAKRSRVGDPTENSNIDAGDLFEAARARLGAAQRELALAQNNLEEAREQIRSNGSFEPDSLLCLCDGEDSPVLSALLEFLASEDIGRCEIVCRALKGQARHCWAKLDEIDLKGYPSRQSPSARNAREKVIRYHVASTLARRIGGMGDSISKHLIVKEFDHYNNIITDKRVDGCCDGCDFPNELDFGVFHAETTGEYELFVRFSRTSDNTLFAEGFVPFTRNDGCTVKIHLEDMDFSSWPQLLEISRLVASEGATFAENDDNHNMLNECMSNLTVTVVGMRKGIFRARLAIAQSNFGDAPNSRQHGIDNLGNHGFCWPRGSLSQYSHGDLKTRRSTYRSDVHENQDSDAKVGMLFDTIKWTDPEDSDRIVTVECRWSLDFSC